jgi:predicted lipoprotein with Yx(FWY)xxD motif
MHLSSWLRGVFVPAATAVLALGLVGVAPELGSPASAQGPSSCATPVTSVPSGPATVSAASSAFGRILVVGSGANSGCSLYVLTSDQYEASATSGAEFACTAFCVTHVWPALLTDGAPIAGPGVNPTLLGTVTRTDVVTNSSVQQVTYAGQPLYQFTFDTAPGQTAGAKLFDSSVTPQGVWYLVEPSRGRPAPGQALVEEETAPVGASSTSATVLAVSGDTGLGGISFPVYTFSADSGHMSACEGTCAVFWPPVLTTKRPLAGLGVDQQQLGIIVRPDGTHQVTYDGHPLYMFRKDAYIPGPPFYQKPSINGAGLNVFGGVFQTLPPIS